MVREDKNGSQETREGLGRERSKLEEGGAVGMGEEGILELFRDEKVKPGYGE